MSLSKGADLRRFDQTTLDAIAAELHGRPRQTLGFKTPSQVLAEALRWLPETAVVCATCRAGGSGRATLGGTRFRTCHFARVR